MPIPGIQFVAGGTINLSRFVRLSAAEDNTVLEGTANCDIFGICQEGADRPPLSDLITTNVAARDGENVRVFRPGEVCLVEAGAAITRGNRLKSRADGTAEPILAVGNVLQRYGAVALQSALAGEKCLVVVEIGSERPALV